MLVLLAGGGAHGYAITAQLEEMGITGGPVDIGQVYRTLRDLEQRGQVTSSWSAEPVGPQRRDYELTDAGYAAIDAWAAVMKERARLIGEFNARYLEAVAAPQEAVLIEAAATAARLRRGRCPGRGASFSSAEQVPVENPEVQLLLGEVDLQHRVEPVEDAPEADLVALGQALVRDKLAVLAQGREQRAQPLVLLAHRRHRVAPVHDLVRAARTAIVSIASMWGTSRPTMKLHSSWKAAENCVGRDAPDHLGEFGQPVDVRLDQLVMLVGRVRERTHDLHLGGVGRPAHSPESLSGVLRRRKGRIARSDDPVLTLSLESRAPLG